MSKPQWQSKPKNEKYNQSWRSKCISSNLNDFDLGNLEEEKITTEPSSELLKFISIAVQNLNPTKKAFYAKDNQEDKKGPKKLNTSAKVWTPTEYKKPVEDKENNVIVNNENKENNQDNKMTKPTVNDVIPNFVCSKSTGHCKSYFNSKKSGLSDSQESSKKVLGDSSTHLTNKQDNQNSYY